jgi:hypothetical protein
MDAWLRLEGRRLAPAAEELVDPAWWPLLPRPPLLIGDVQDVSEGAVAVARPGGLARGGVPGVMAWSSLAGSRQPGPPVGAGGEPVLPASSAATTRGAS